MNITIENNDEITVVVGDPGYSTDTLLTLLNFIPIPAGIPAIGATIIWNGSQHVYSALISASFSFDALTPTFDSLTPTMDSI